MCYATDSPRYPIQLLWHLVPNMALPRTTPRVHLPSDGTRAICKLFAIFRVSSLAGIAPCFTFLVAYAPRRRPLSYGATRVVLASTALFGSCVVCPWSPPSPTTDMECVATKGEPCQKLPLFRPYSRAETRTHVQGGGASISSIRPHGRWTVIGCKMAKQSTGP